MDEEMNNIFGDYAKRMREKYGENWKEATEGLDPSGLLRRKENWGRVAPEGAIVITASVDVQDDRLEVEVIVLPKSRNVNGYGNRRSRKHRRPSILTNGWATKIGTLTRYCHGKPP